MIERHEHITPQRHWLRENFFVEIGAFRLFASRLQEKGIGADADTATRPTLVFLHEGLGSVAQWRDFPLVLGMELGMPCFIYDRRGHGRSTALPEPHHDPRYLHTEALEILPAVLQAAQIERPVLVGHSDGGSIALLYASAFPQNVEALAVIAAHTLVEDVSIEGVKRAVEHFEKDEGFKSALRKYHGEKTETIFYAWGNVWTSPEFYPWNIKWCLKDITAPILVIQGSDDEYATLEQVHSIVQGVSSPLVRSYIVEGNGHSPHITGRSKVLSAIKHFLGEVRAQTPE